jgi:hypothetical protein
MQAWPTPSLHANSLRVLAWEPILRESRDTEIGRRDFAHPLCGYGHTRDLLAALEALGHLLAGLGGGESVAFRLELLSHGTIGRKESLGVTQ